jgi:hypothetical protein
MVRHLTKFYLALHKYLTMKRHIRKMMVVSMLVSVGTIAFADRGAGKKSKAKTILNISTATPLKSSIFGSLKSGLTYKGSLLTTRQTSTGSMVNNSLMTYQKGNTTYIIPYKSKITVPDTKQNYTGVKLIIRRNK